MISKYLKGKILVMIDAANLESSVKSLGWWIDYIKLRDLFKEKELVEIRDYCVYHNTDNQNKFFTFLKKNGFILITKPLKVIKTEDIERGDIRKANFDVEIAIDAMEMINKFDTFVLFSGDSDFDYLLKKIRGKNKNVLVISSKHHISKELIENSDKYIDIKKLKNLIKRENKSPSFATGG
ncbi:MAG: NYN domain-containing protein [Candidatus Pacebacteria bacterium]|nr:NYN domain-containing protein [Candidatus Paceibacterota bacterium]